MKEELIKGNYGMIEASKKEIDYFESFEGEPVDLNQLIAKSKTKKEPHAHKKAVTRR